MRNFDGISFIWALIILAVIAVIYGVRAFMGYRTVARDADLDYVYRQGENMLDKRLSKDGFLRAYKRFHNPRGTAYVAGIVGAILVLTAPALLLIQLILQQVWLLSGQSRVFEPGFLVWQFFIFFAIIGIWALIAYLGARRYHKYAPISLRDEMLKEMDD